MLSDNPGLTGSKPSIMVVDDDPASLRLLEDALRQKDYEVRSFPRGRLALAAIERELPDLILLDVSMPELTGYEVCERLKSDSRAAEVPVIFITGLRETEDKVKAFQSGGVDHISKPFQLEEVYARVKTHLRLHELQQELKVHNETLEQAVASRTRELAEANLRLTRLDRAKNDFLNTISHELRTPLNGLFGVSELVMGELSAYVEEDEFRQMFEQSRERILSLLDDALLLTQIDVRGKQFSSAPVPLASILTRAIKRVNDCAKSHGVTILPPCQETGLVRGDEDLLVRAVHALLETAVRFSDQGGTVSMTSESAAGSLKLIIDSRGRTLPHPAMTKFFDVFSNSEVDTLGEDLGLAPALACRILLLFGFVVTVANGEQPGIRLTVSF